MMNRKHFVTTLVASVLLLCGSRVDAKDYEIKFERPKKVGDTAQIDQKFTDHSKMTISFGGPAQEQVNKNNLTLSGDVKVLEVGAKGEATKISCTVKKCESTKDDGAVVEIVPAGTVLVAHYEGGKKQIKREDGQPISDKDSQLIGRVLSVNEPGKPNNDEQFGTTERKKVGDTWEANREKLVDGLKDEDVPINKDALKGTVKLVEVREEEGVESMVLHIEINGDMDKNAAIKDLPPGLTLQDGKMVFTMDVILPTDVTLAHEKTNSDGTFNVNLGGNANGVPISMKMNATMKTESNTRASK